jgi:acyl-CoA dehydrogenase
MNLVLLISVVVLVCLVGVPVLRRAILMRFVFSAYRKALPEMSRTEQDALEAGTVWWEGELFRGAPDWGKLMAYPVPRLSAEEQSFLDNECEEANRMLDDWQVTERLRDLPEEVWRYIKDKGFLGMIIPKRYGGLEFSAFAHSQIVTKLSTRSSALAVSVMVPNSLGPAELLLHYGTDAQKEHYLPRLARGEDIPAFALTSPWAGSDAASIPDVGVVCKGQWNGQEVIGMKVSFDKRYITLAPVCTVFGLAFHLFDPEGLLGTEKHIGITCALVPAKHPGVDIGQRHFPLNAMFMNGPVRGTDVFMPLDFIIGGKERAGQGWRMLMECLAAGRSISLPSSNTGMAQMTSRAVGAYARVRAQFRMAVGRFEGVSEVLARIGGHTYLMDAARRMTAGAIDLGERPSVVSAIVKYHVTERARAVVNDGMDIIGGKGICLGPSNLLGRAYQQIPIGITVEGANILTRSLIVFGQGAIRCHPYVLKEMQAAQNPDRAAGLAAFDAALIGHLAFTLKNAGRAFFHGITGARFVAVSSAVAPSLKRHTQRLTRASAAFAFLADVCLLVLRGSLKRRESLSARLGDILSQLYLASTVLKRYEEEGRQADDRVFAEWALEDALWRIQNAFEGILANFPVRPVAWMLRLWLFPWGFRASAPTDALGRDIAAQLMAPSPSRDRLTALCYIPPEADDPVAAVEAALQATIAAEPIEAKIRAAEKAGRFEHNPQATVRDMASAARALGVINDEEHARLIARNRLRDQVIRVDDFPFDLSVKNDAFAPASVQGETP